MKKRIYVLLLMLILLTAACAYAAAEPEKPIVLGIGSYHTVGLKPDGTVVATGAGSKDYGESNVSGWTDIVSLAAGTHHTLGVRVDGTVIATGYNKHGQCDVQAWTDIVQVDAAYDFSVGLRADGTVVGAGSNGDKQLNFGDWTDIVSVCAGYEHTVGLRADGTVVAVGDNSYSQCNVSSWRNVVDIAAGEYFTAALMEDGTVKVAYSGDGSIRYDLSGWRGIVDIAATYTDIIGLQKDGTVVCCNGLRISDVDVSAWRNIKSIEANVYQAFGIKADGSVVFTGNNKQGQGNVSKWKLKAPAAATNDVLTTIPTGTLGGAGTVREEEDDRPYVLRKARWGDSIEDIIAEEGEPLLESEMSNLDARYIAYEVQVVGLDALIAYYFCDDGLFEIRYVLTEEHSNDDLYIDDYEKISDALQSKYGKPFIERIMWNDDSMKEYYTENGKSMGDALCYGYCEYMTWYTLDDYDILLSMSADNYEISTYIDYECSYITPGEPDYSNEI